MSPMPHRHSDSSRRTIFALALLLAAYLAALLAGWPQRATARIAARAEQSPPAHHVTTAEKEPHEGSSGGAVAACPATWTVVPFGLLLAAIAILPLVPQTSHWWENNWHRFYVAGGLGLLTLSTYLFTYHQPVMGHWPIDHLVAPSPGPLNWHVTATVAVNALAGEYFPFIILLFSLYVISGGIQIDGDFPAHPLVNTAFLGVGALLASLIGTTGAAMLLIRPLLQTNRQRQHVQHTVILFIFVVCNCGGCLLPLGDPPLFLGYLFGVPFWWTLKLWPAWLLLNGLLLTIYFLGDHFWYYPRESPRDVDRDERPTRPLRLRGVWPNGLLLAGVILSVALLDPGKPWPGTSWHPWVYLREAVLLVLVAISLGRTAKTIRRHNDFDYGPILEVAALFVGIFLAMQPPLAILHSHGPSLGLATPVGFFWATGSLSAVLDNAPTYAVFFETARSLGGAPTVAGVKESLLAAISLGAVFMGAMTYIGNGPNFMVRSIAEKSGIGMPSFFGYVIYSALILLPLLWITTWLVL